jgi:hypothetical protein
MDIKTRKIFTRIVLWLIIKLKSDSAADFWFWEMTPAPFSLPTNRQLKDGVRFAFKLPVKGKYDFLEEDFN